MEWVDIKEKLPDDETQILIHTDDGEILSAFKSNDQFYFENEFSEYIEHITHWMPMPKPPEKFKSRKEKAQEKFDESWEKLNGQS